MSNALDASRPSTPESPATESFIQASATIDDLTRALTNFSRTSLEPTPSPKCCCGRDECETTRAWTATRQKLENGLVLSAEVGQALLQRHEAYIRRQNSLAQQSDGNAGLLALAQEKATSLQQSNDRLVGRMADFAKEHNMMQKRLAQSLLNLEVADSSNRTLVNELQETRSSLAKLSAYHARSVGWETRLESALQERDDFLQEKISETNRAKTLELKARAATEQCGKLQAEIFTLQAELDNRRLSSADISEEILQDARARLEMLQNSLGQSTHPDDAETTRILETLVADNEALKRDNAELQNLLTESREELRGLREEVEEKRATPVRDEFNIGPPPVSHFIPLHGKKGNWVPVPGRGHRSSTSWAASFSSSRIPPSPHRHLSVSERSSPLHQSTQLPETQDHDNFQSLDDIRNERTPQLEVPPDFTFPASPAASSFMTDEKHTAFNQPQTPVLFTPSQSSLELDRGAISDSSSAGSGLVPIQYKPKHLMLLARSRAVQTDPAPLYHVPSRPSTSSGTVSSTPPPPEHSDTSTTTFDPTTPPFPALIDRVAALLARLTQSDIRSLSSRLKRQNLPGGDLRHLSKATINSVLTDVSNLRVQFRAALEVERHEATRKDLRALLKLFKDLFTELGQLRGTLNEITLDPSAANKLGEQATSEGERGRSVLPKSSAMGWISAPIAKLFGPTTEATDVTAPPLPSPKRRGQEHNARQAAPKLAAAVSASTTTVNVEFASTGTRRAMATIPDVQVSSVPSGEASHHHPDLLASRSGPSSKVEEGRRENLLGIFAGAPRNVSGRKDNWLVLPSKNKPDRPKRQQGMVSASPAQDATIGRTAKRLSRNLDAIIDSIPHTNRANPSPKETNFQATLLERTQTLRSRGLSDSSIHSTFLASPVNRLLTPSGIALSGSSGPDNAAGQSYGGWDKQSVLQALSKKIENFRAQNGPPAPTSAGSLDTQSIPSTSAPQPISIPKQTSLEIETDSPASSSPKSIHQPRLRKDMRSVSPSARFQLPNLTSWAVGSANIDAMSPERSDTVGSLREDSVLSKHWARGVARDFSRN